MSQEFNLAAYVLSEADRYREKTALELLGTDERWTYGELKAAVYGVAHGLQVRGLNQGDTVLLRLGNSSAFPIVYLGAILAGCIPVPTSAQLTVPEVTQIAAEVRPKLITAETGLSLPENSPCPVLMRPEIVAMYSRPPAMPHFGNPNRLAYIIYTSGTSGQPRAVMHAHRAILARRSMWDGWYGLKANDRLLHAGAFNWTYTLGTGLMDPWSIGATALIPAPGTPAAALPGLIESSGATIFAAAPGVYRQMLKSRNSIDAPALRHGLSAGEKCPATTANTWRDATGTALHEAFGMSECSTFLSGSPDRPAPPETLGYAQEGRSIAVIDADGQPVPPDIEGDIAIDRGDHGLMLGYLNAPDETAARYRGNWFVTGDRGSRSADGAFCFLGRGDDMMNAGGYRLSPLEVENAMNSHPDITDCAAVELPVKKDVTVIGLFYTGTELPDAVLKAHAEDRLARYKCPRIFIHRKTLPRSANGKLQRPVLRQEFEGGS